MNNYICKNNLWHDSPVIDGKPSSNNGWIYTAMAKQFGFMIHLNPEMISQCLRSAISDRYFWVHRLPGMPTPPESRDEAIGKAILSRNFYEILKKASFHLCRQEIREDYSYLESALALIEIRKEHRNYVWKNEILPGYKLAFKLMPHDVYFMKKLYDNKTSTLEYLLSRLYILTTLIKGNTSDLNVLWVQLTSIKSYRLSMLINLRKSIPDRFPDDHPFTRLIQ